MPFNKQSTFYGIAFGLFASFIWGGWPVFSKMATLQSITPWDITAIRFIVAGLLLLPILLLRFKLTKQLLLKGFILSLGAGTPYVLMATIGLTYAPSAHFGIIAPSTMLLCTTLGSVFLIGEKITPLRLFGVACIFFGVIIVGGSSIGSISGDTLRGDIMFVGCGILWSSYTLLCKHWNIDAWMATALVSVVSLALYFPFYITYFPNNLSGMSIPVLLQQGLIQGIMTAILALFFYSKAVSLLGSSKGSVFGALVPPITLFLAVVLLGEAITWAEQLGIISVSIGILFALGIIKRLPLSAKKSIV
ncbi:MAG: drug/metabolite transporter (DMT)-like permease [Oceanospirillaceae bacterium]|jgi:drug/metabolite transporter (DMT)-like permease